jgi:hypothetical protein
MYGKSLMMQERFEEAVETYLSTASLLQVQLSLLSNQSLPSSIQQHSPTLKIADALLTLLTVYMCLLNCYQQTDDILKMRHALDEANFLVEGFLSTSPEARRIISRPNEVWNKLYKEKCEAIKALRRFLADDYQNRWGAGAGADLDQIGQITKDEKHERAKGIMKKEIMQHMFEKHYANMESPFWVKGRDTNGKPILANTNKIGSVNRILLRIRLKLKQ